MTEVLLWVLAGYVLGVLTVVAATLYLVRRASAGRHRVPRKVLARGQRRAS